MCVNMWDLVAITLLDLLNVKVINHDLLTPAKVQNPHSVHASCRCISFAARDSQSFWAKGLKTLHNTDS